MIDRTIRPDDQPDAASLYRLLADPASHVPSTDPTTTRANRTGAGPRPPARLDIVDHLQACADEITQHAVAAGATAPKPADRADLYTWARDHTTGEQRQADLDAITWRHAVQHQMRLEGHGQAIRTEPCPACLTWGLSWDPASRRAICLNQRCANRRTGAPSTWTLAQLAHHHVARTPRRAAT